MCSALFLFVQIRAQLASRGHPIVGDIKYGAPSAFKDRSLSLHCWRLGWGDVKTGEKMWIEAPPPASWEQRFGHLLKGRRAEGGGKGKGPWEDAVGHWESKGQGGKEGQEKEQGEKVGDRMSEERDGERGSEERSGPENAENDGPTK